MYGVHVRIFLRALSGSRSVQAGRPGTTGCCFSRREEREPERKKEISVCSGVSVWLARVCALGCTYKQNDPPMPRVTTVELRDMDTCMYVPLPLSLPLPATTVLYTSTGHVLPCAPAQASGHYSDRVQSEGTQRKAKERQLELSQESPHERTHALRTSMKPTLPCFGTEKSRPTILSLFLLCRLCQAREASHMP